MLRLLWNLSIHVHTLLQYAPTNLLIRAIRTRRGLKWGVPAMLLAPVYLFAAGIFFTLREDGGPSWIAFLGMVMLWNSFKFVWIGPISLIALTRRAIRRRNLRAEARSGTVDSEQGPLARA